MTIIAEKIIKSNILVSDGAKGTFFHKKGLDPGECSEFWNIENSNEVFDIAISNIDTVIKIIGGYCGTTPEHIRKIAKSFKKNSNSQFDLKKKPVYLKCNIYEAITILLILHQFYC